MISASWLWLYFGAFMMFLELATPGFVMFFFGLAAASVGLLARLVGDEFSLAWQFAAFPVLALFYLVFLRRYLKKIFSGTIKESKGGFTDEYVGRVGKVIKAIEPPNAGRILIGDAEWTAESKKSIVEGVAVKVVAQNNLTMYVEEM